MTDSRFFILTVVLLILVCPVMLGGLLFVAAAYGIPYATVVSLMTTFGAIYTPMVLALVALLAQMLCPSWTDAAITYIKLKFGPTPAPQESGD